MKKKYAWVGIPLVLVLVAIAYQYLPEGEHDPDISDEPELGFSGMPETLADGQPVASEQKMETGSPGAPEQRHLQRDSEKKGDRTRFSMSHGDIGYVDVQSVMLDQDPYSIVDLLQAHEDLTGAGDSLEIKIEDISENEFWGQGVRYRQVINGQPTRQGGKVFFSSDGAVTRLRGTLIDSRSLNDGDIVILAAEAEAIALDVAAGYAENVTSHPAEMRYDVDAESNLERLWRVEVSFDWPNPGGIRVFISPETGEVVRVDSALVYFQATADHTIHVLDADSPAPGKQGARAVVWEDGKCMITPLCNDPKYTTPLETVRDVIADVQSVSKRRITSPITIMVNYPKKLLNAAGAWDEDDGTIFIRVDVTDLEMVAAHEAHHAASLSPEGKVEHGLVYAMMALRGYDSWNYIGHSVTSTNRTYTDDGRHTTNMMYRIAQEVGDEAAYEFVLEVDQGAPASMNSLVYEMRNVSWDLNMPITVHRVLLDVGEIDSAAYNDMLLNVVASHGVGTQEWVEDTRQQFEEAGIDEAEGWQLFILWLERWLRRNGSD